MLVRMPDFKPQNAFLIIALIYGLNLVIIIFILFTLSVAVFDVLEDFILHRTYLFLKLIV